MPTIRDLAQTEKEALTPPPNLFGRPPVPFGLYHMDEAFFLGVEPWVTQVYALQGGSGGRKTTTMLNIIKNQCLSGLLPASHWIGVDSLEGGMTIERYYLILKCMLASQLIIYKTWTGEIGNDSVWQFVNRPLPSRNGRPVGPRELVEGCKASNGRPELIMNPDFVKGWYSGLQRCTFSPMQKWAWDIAHEVVSGFPVRIEGVSEHYDAEERQRRFTNTTNLEASYERWLELHRDYGVRQLVIDYIDSYFIPGVYKPFEKQLRVMPYIDQFTKQTGCTAWALAQEGATRQKDADANYGEVYGSFGGDILQSYSQTNFRTAYYPNRNSYITLIYAPLKSRRGRWPNFGVFTDPYSGVFFGRTMDFAELERIDELQVARRKR